MKHLRFLVLCAAAALWIACDGSPSGEDERATAEPRASVTEIPEPEEALSEPLMVALSMAQSFHHKADVYLKEGELERATVALREIFNIPFPEGAPEGEDVTLDARARLGKVLLRRQELDEAQAVVEDGIEAASRDSFFLANLYRVKGQVLAARGDELAETEPERAAELRREAIGAFDHSIAIGERLLESLPVEPIR